MLDIVAWIILGVLWIFGGAAIFDSSATKYYQVVTGWALLNIIVIVITIISIGALWALNRVLA